MQSMSQPNQFLPSLPTDCDVWTVVKNLQDNISAEDARALLEAAFTRHQLAKVDASSKADKTKKTLTIYAAEQGNVHVIHWLRSKFTPSNYHAEVLKKDNQGLIAVDYALAGNKSEAVIRGLMSSYLASVPCEVLLRAIKLGNAEAVKIFSLRDMGISNNSWMNFDRIKIFSTLAHASLDEGVKKNMAKSLCEGYGRATYTQDTMGFILTLNFDYKSYAREVRDALNVLFAKQPLEIQVVNSLLYPEIILLASDTGEQEGGVKLIFAQVFSVLTKHAQEMSRYYPLLKALLQPLKHLYQELPGYNPKLTSIARFIISELMSQPTWKAMQIKILQEALNHKDVQMVLLLSAVSEDVQKCFIKQPDLVRPLFDSSQPIAYKKAFIPLAMSVKSLLRETEAQGVQAAINETEARYLAEQDAAKLKNIQTGLTKLTVNIAPVLECCEKNKAAAKSRGVFPAVEQQYQDALDLLKSQVIVLARMLKVSSAELEKIQELPKDPGFQAVTEAKQDGLGENHSASGPTFSARAGLSPMFFTQSSGASIDYVSPDVEEENPYLLPSKETSEESSAGAKP